MNLIKASIINLVDAFCFLSHDFFLRCGAQTLTFMACCKGADVVELVDTLDLGSSGLNACGGSSPPVRTKLQQVR
jgi:hypothetical protein